MLQMRLDGQGRPTGVVAPAGGEETTFVGWTALMSELSGLLEPAGPEQADR